MWRLKSIAMLATAILASRRRGLAALVLGASAVGSCAAATKFESTQFGGRYQGVEFEYIAGGRDFHTVVRGNPFGGDDAVFANRVVAILNARNTRQRSNFTTEPGPSARLQFRMVLVFNPVGRAPPNTLCSEPDSVEAAPPNPQTIAVHAAYCNGAVAVTSVRGSVGGDDDAFEQLLAEMLTLLFPHRGFRRRGFDDSD